MYDQERLWFALKEMSLHQVEEREGTAPTQALDRGADAETRADAVPMEILEDHPNAPMPVNASLFVLPRVLPLRRIAGPFQSRSLPCLPKRLTRRRK